MQVWTRYYVEGSAGMNYRFLGAPWEDERSGQFAASYTTAPMQNVAVHQMTPVANRPCVQQIPRCPEMARMTIRVQRAAI